MFRISKNSFKISNGDIKVKVIMMELFMEMY